MNLDLSIDRQLSALDFVAFGGVYNGKADCAKAFLAACASGREVIISGPIALSRIIVPSSGARITLMPKASIKFLKPTNLLSTMITFTGDDVSFAAYGLLDGNDCGCSLVRFDGARGFAHMPQVKNVSIKTGSSLIVSALDVRGPNFIGGVIDCDDFKRNGVTFDAIPSAPRAVSVQGNAINFLFNKIRAAGAESTDTLVSAGLAGGHIDLLEGVGNVDNVFYAVGGDTAGRITIGRMNCINGADEALVVKNNTQVAVQHLYIEGYCIAPMRYENHGSVSIGTIEINNRNSTRGIGTLLASRSGNVAGGPVYVGEIIGTTAVGITFSIFNGTCDEIHIGKIDVDILLDATKTNAATGAGITFDIGRIGAINTVSRVIIGEWNMRFYDVQNAIPAGSHAFTQISRSLLPGSSIGKIQIECFTGTPTNPTPATNFDHRCQYFLQPNLRLTGPLHLDTLNGGSIYIVSRPVAGPRTSDGNTTNRDPRLASDEFAYFPVDETFKLTSSVKDIRYRCVVAGYVMGTGNVPKALWTVDGHNDVTTAQLQSATDPINATGKYAGKSGVWDTTASRPVIPLGGSPTSQWKYPALGAGDTPPATITPA